MSGKTPENGQAIRWAAASALMLGGLALALGACAPQSESSAAGAVMEQAVEDPLSQAGVAGEVPADLLRAIIEDLAQQENLAAGDIEVERADEVIWPDGALGCPKPGEMYTHAEVPGFWIVLRAAGKQYDYRAAARGYFRRCGSPFKRQAPVG